MHTHTAAKQNGGFSADYGGGFYGYVFCADGGLDSFYCTLIFVVCWLCVFLSAMV